MTKQESNSIDGNAPQDRDTVEELSDRRQDIQQGPPGTIPSTPPERRLTGIAGLDLHPGVRLPYGYAAEAAEEGVRLVIDEAAALSIRMAFDRYLNLWTGFAASDFDSPIE